MAAADRYSALSADSILTTLARLGDRVRERFPDRGLTGVCAELQRIAKLHVKRVADVSKPHLLLRGLVGLVLVAGLFVAGVGVEQKVRQLMNNPDAIGFEGIEAIANILILMGAAIWFLLNLEARIKRSQALSALHELRSIAHVIDMHQLTKDPYRHELPDTAHSPKRAIHGALLERYLDYCSELLSLTGKLAALFAQSSRDAEVASAASDIEQLANGLARKSWEKMMELPQG